MELTTVYIRPIFSGLNFRESPHKYGLKHASNIPTHFTSFYYPEMAIDHRLIDDPHEVKKYRWYPQGIAPCTCMYTYQYTYVYIYIYIYMYMQIRCKLELYHKWLRYMNTCECMWINDKSDCMLTINWKVCIPWSNWSDEGRQS